MATFSKRSGKHFVQIRRKGFATVCRTFHLKSDAEEWARHMESKADRGDLPAPVRVLDSYKVSDILTRYRDEVTPKKRGAFFERYVINAFLRLPIANLTMAQVTTAHFSSYREKRLKEVSPATINRQLGVIRHSFDLAIRDWGIPMRENPLAKLRKYKVNDARLRRLEEGEFKALETAALTCRNPLLMPLVLLALETAMRRGELLALEWKYINLEQRIAHIPVTKNGHSRTIPLTLKAVEILQGARVLNHSQSSVFNLNVDAVDSAWGRLVERAKLKNLRFHDLRHEAISRFFEKGLSIPEVALISGHKDFRMLFRYTHLRAENLVSKLD